MTNSQKHAEKITGYWFRGLRYAMTSAATIVAGYVMQIPEPQKNDLLALNKAAWTLLKNDLLYLGIPILASVYFFIRYAIRFPRSDAIKTTSEDVLTFARSEAVRLYLFLVLLPYSAFVIYHVSRSEPLSASLLLAVALFVGLFISYGRFLATYESGENHPLIRHWLIWPVVLSIGIGLFFGLSFSKVKASLFPLTPVILVVLLFLGSLKLPRLIYLWSNLFIVLAVTTVALLNQASYFHLPPMLDISGMLFCVAASAYLAVFEAGSITSDIAREDGSDRRAHRYAQATLVALTMTVWLLPFYYIFSSYGPAFLIGFAVHAFFAFIIWFYLGREPYLSKWQWSDIKVIPGVLFLALLVLSPTQLFSQHWPFHFQKNFSNWVIGVAVFVAVFFILIGLLVKDYVALRDTDNEHVIIELFKDRVNFTRVLGALCFAFCGGIAFRLLFVSESSPEYSRADLAFLIYTICFILCFVVEIIEFFRRPKRKPVPIATSLMGLLLIIRVFTTFLIGLAVFLPLYLGGVGLAKSFYSSLPFFCIAAGGFAINDCCDLVADRINKPYRAIPSGRISPGVAKTVGVSLIVVGSLISVLVYRTPFQFALFVVSMAGVAFYNLIVKYLSLTKTILTAGVSVLPLVFVIKSLSYPTIYLLLPIAGMSFLLGRELLMDIRDVNGDRAANVKTLPILFGPRITAAIAFLFFALCSGTLMFFSVAVLSARNVILSSAISLMSLLLPCAWYYRSGSYRRVVILTLYVPIVCGILLLIR